MKRILVPIDFSLSSQNAAKYAANMAIELNMKVTLFHVIELYQYTAWVQETEIITPMFPLNDIPKMELIAQNNLTQLEQELKQINPNLIVEKLLIKGTYIYELIPQTAIDETEFIVVSSFNNHDFLDNTKSNMRVLYYESACPIIIVPQNATYKSINNLLYVTSFQPYDINILQHIAKTLHPTLPETAILQVINHKPDYEDTLKLLGFQKLVENTFSNILFKFEMIRNKEIENTIKEIAEKNNNDLVVLIKENKHLLQSMFESVHSLKLSQMLHIPLLLFSERVIQNIQKTK
jgi:hypothetical protein